LVAKSAVMHNPFLPFLPLKQQFATRNNVGTTMTQRQGLAVRLEAAGAPIGHSSYLRAH
jgi:hypothetical protein